MPNERVVLKPFRHVFIIPSFFFVRMRANLARACVAKRHARRRTRRCCACKSPSRRLHALAVYVNTDAEASSCSPLFAWQCNNSSSSSKSMRLENVRWSVVMFRVAVNDCCTAIFLMARFSVLTKKALVKNSRSECGNYLFAWLLFSS